MQQFNLIVSTARDFEAQAEAELWFHLMSLGDPNPIIFLSPFQGLILAQTSIQPRRVVSHLRTILQTKDADHLQFVQKMYPIDAVVATELDPILTTTLALIAETPICQPPTSKFRITIRKRHSPLATETIIDHIAHNIHHEVDLKHFDWNIQFEILGNSTGIAILTEDDVLKPLSEQREVLFRVEEHEVD